MEKYCPRCQEVKPLGSFQNNRRRPDGKQAWCQICTNTYQTQKRHEHFDEWRAYQRAWQDAHKPRRSRRSVTIQFTD